MSRYRRSSLGPLLLLVLGGCYSAECDCVGPVPVVTGIVIAGVPTGLFRVGDKTRLTATVQASGVLADTRVTWRTATPTIVDVDQDGLVTAVGAGTGAVLAIASADTTKVASAVIRVE